MGFLSIKLATAAFSTLFVTLVLAAVALAAPPSNDDRADATVLTLPASVRGTTEEATLEESEPEFASNCGAVRASVWYSVPAGAARRIAIRVAAAGDVDALIDVFRPVRSQLEPVTCETTDQAGDAALTFGAGEGQRYLIRVGRRPNSVDGEFRLDVFSPQPPARPPGRPLPPGGLSRSVDRLQNTDDAFATRMRSGRSYRINLAPANGRCVGLRLFGPGTKSFSGRSLRSLRCGGYLLFTPGPGGGGRHSLLVESNDRSRGAQRYRLTVAPAGRDDTLPGRRLGPRARGFLRGRRADVVDLYRFDVLRRSDVRLRLRARGDFEVVLLGQGGRRLDSSTSVASRRLRVGRYFAAVRARGAAAGAYRLKKVVRTITSTRATVNGGRSAQVRPGSTVSVGALVSPGQSGPVQIDVERLDPLSGWQFVRRYNTRAAGGRAGVPFRPSAEGRYRVSAVFRGTRSAAPSTSRRFARLLVAEPLRP